MAKMAGIFVNENGCVRYADAIVKGIKTIETRNRNMLKCLVGKRVAIVRTRRGKLPMVVGYADIVDSYFCPINQYEKYRDQTLVPEGSAYDVHGKGKWLYFLTNAEKCDPFPLPQDAVRHGLSWCEYDDPNHVTWTVHTKKGA